MTRVSFAFVATFLTTLTTLCVAQESLSLEDEFFELMWLCDSRVEQERDDAQKELEERFAEFEPIWQERTFLTDGQVAEESRRRFELAETAYRKAREKEARETFDARLSVAKSIEKDGVETRVATARVRWRAPLRVVWIAPDFHAFLWRDPETNRLWRPRALFSAPEASPALEDEEVEFNVVLEPFDSAPKDAPREELAFESLVGVESRPWAIPIDTESTAPKEYRSGELTLRGANAMRSDKGEWIVALRMEYDVAFDAFDSHRSWYDVDDFLLVCPRRDAPCKATRMRALERDAKGERVELLFAAEPKLDETFEKKDAILFCRLPRFFLRTRIAL